MSDKERAQFFCMLVDVQTKLSQYGEPDVAEVDFGVSIAEKREWTLRTLLTLDGLSDGGGGCMHQLQHARNRS